MRILIVTRNLPPLVGGMERLNWHMAEELAKVAEVRIVGPVGSAALAPAGVRVREVPLKPLWKFLWCARASARREAKAWHPDIVLAGSGLTAPIARSAARTCGARTAAYVHGLDLAVRHPVYRALWLPAIRSMDKIIANSRATADLSRAVGVDGTRVAIVHPGVDLPNIPHPSERGADRIQNARDGDPGSAFSADNVRSSDVFRQRHRLDDGPLLLSVGRLSARKGLREFVFHALPQIVAARPDVTLAIVGDTPDDALYAQEQSQENIWTAATQSGVADHVTFLGRLAETELLAAYGAADVHVFPIREIPGDPEGFGMVAVEAAAHGLPTVAFATGGVIDAVSEGRSGHLVNPGDYSAMADAVPRTIEQREALRESCIEFARQFAWPRFGAQLAAQLGVS